MKKYTSDEIAKMDYSRFVSLINERNRPSGGIKTVHTVAVNALISSESKILEIGSNTGFTSVNLSLLTGCSVIGIDINADSVKKADGYAQQMGVKNKVQFVQASATKIPFDNDSFDAVWASNVTSFIEDKETALKEYLRVLKVGGVLIVVPIYYRKKVPMSIVNDVSVAIGVQIKEWTKSSWINFFTNIADKTSMPLELFFEKDFEFDDREENIASYVDDVIDTNVFDGDLVNQKFFLKERFTYFMSLFNENLKYAGFSIFLFQKRQKKDEKELFIAHETNKT